MQVIGRIGRVEMVRAGLAGKRLEVVVRMAVRSIGDRLAGIGWQNGRVACPAHEHGQEQRDYHLSSDCVAKHFRSTSPEENPLGTFAISPPGG